MKKLRERTTNDTSVVFEFLPLTSERWKDLEQLFGKNGACAGCWCMWWRLSRPEWEKGKGEGNRKELRRLAQRGKEPGLIAYANGEPAGWVSLGPRSDFPRFDTSRILKPVDDQAVWSVVCFFVGRRFRKKGLTEALLRAAAQYTKKKGARILEGYPIEPKTDQMPDLYAYTGLASVFRKAGFSEVARRSETRPIMRLLLTTKTLRNRG